MSSYGQQQAPVYPPPQNAYPPPGQAYPPAAEGYPAPAYVAPPPAGYPMKDGPGNPQQGPVETKARGEGDDGFWKGCCAAICCCCVLDMCCD